MAKTQKQLVEDIERKLNNLEAKVDYKIQTDIDGILADIQELKKGAETFVLVRDFKPYVDGVNWAIKIVLGAVIMAVLALILRSSK